MNRVVGIDADLIVYAAGFVLEKRIKNNEKADINNAQQIVDTIIRKILRESKATHYLGFLTSGKDNFRLTLATTLKYKGNRDKAKQTPLPFKQEMLNYMIVHWGFQMMKGVEADDALTIAGEYFRDRPETYILATKDKDLWQWPGEHFNMNTNQLMFINEEEGNRNLWKQVIVGDMGTDNIPGLSYAAKHDVWTTKVNRHGTPDYSILPEHKYGPKAAEAILDSVDPKDYAATILELYLTAYPWDVDLGHARFEETFALVYMLLEKPEGLKLHYDYRECSKKDLEAPSGFEGYRATLQSEF